MTTRFARVLLAAALVWPSGRLFAQHDMTGMSMPGSRLLGRSTMASGTAWLPESTTMRGAMRRLGTWDVGLQANLFGVYNRQGVTDATKRGDTQWGLVDWEMAIATHRTRTTQWQLRAMTSLEPFTLGGAGYPLLLQTGGTFRHGVLHDRQHPHNAIMEVAGSYERTVRDRVAATLYVAAVGEPALGPVAAMHRPSAMRDPLSPLGHHWQDASHQSFGVVTAGLNTASWRLEGSLFNPREPDEHHLIVDYRGAKLDSYAGRVSWAPSPHVVASTWYGFLNAHNRLDPTTRMHRYGTSISTDSRGIAGGRWSSTLVWAMNLHHHGGASHELIHGGPGASPHHHASSLLAESTLELGLRTSLFARAERVRKNGEELGFLGGDLTALYDVRSFVIGLTRDVITVRGATASLGGRASATFVPRSLLATYGTRRPSGIAAYVQVQPRR